MTVGGAFCTDGAFGRLVTGIGALTAVFAAGAALAAGITIDGCLLALTAGAAAGAAEGVTDDEAVDAAGAAEGDTLTLAAEGCGSSVRGEPAGVDAADEAPEANPLKPTPSRKPERTR